MGQQQSLNEMNFQEISGLLRINRKLITINEESEQLGFGQLFHVKNTTGEEFSLLILSELNCYYHHTHKQKGSYIQSIKKKVDFLRMQNSPHLAKCFDDFMLGSYYVIQMEKFACSLQKWISDDSSSIFNKDKLRFSEICSQMLRATKAVHKGKYILDHVSALQSFAISQDSQIKLINFEESYKTQQSDIQQYFDSALKKNNLFYYLPDTLSISEKDQSLVIDESSDIWCLGMCFYHLAGASVEHILKYIQSKERFLTIEELGQDINAILISILVIKQDNSYRPSIRSMIKSFQRLQDKFKQNSIQKSQELDKERNNYCSKSDEEQRFENYLGNSLECCEFTLTSFGIQNFDKYQRKPQTIVDCIVKKNENSKLQKANMKLIEEKTKTYDYFQNAMRKFESYCEFNEESDIAQMYIGILNLEQYQQFEAKVYLSIALSINPHSDQVYLEFGKLFYADNQIDKALYCFDKAIRINQSQHRYVKSLLGSNFFQYVPKKVSLSFNEIEIMDTKSLQKEADILMKQYRIKSALYLYQKALGYVTPEDALLIKERILQFCMDQKIMRYNDKKLDALKMLIENNFHNDTVLEIFNNLSISEKKTKESFEFYETQIQKKPQKYIFYLFLARLYCKNPFSYDYYIEIINYFKKYIELNPTSSDAYLELVQFYKIDSFRTDYVKFYLKAINNCSSKSPFYDGLGVLYEQKEKLPQAIISTKQLLKMYRTDEVYKRLFYLYKLSGKHEAAMKLTREQILTNRKQRIGQFSQINLTTKTQLNSSKKEI